MQSRPSAAGERASRPERLTSVIVFAVWTGFVWVTRIRNAGADGPALAMAAVFVAVAGVVVFAWWKRTPWLTGVVYVLAALTVAVWLVRGTLVWVNDNTIGFKLVHTVLGVVSIGLAVWAVWALRRAAGSTKSDVERERETTATSTGLQELTDR